MLKLRDSFDYTAIKDEEGLRRICARLCEEFPDAPRLKNIAFVGAYDAEIGGYRDDSDRLTQTLIYLLQSGFLLDEDFQVDPINFREKRDFLSEDGAYDVVFVSYIRNQRGDEDPNYKSPHYRVFRHSYNEMVLSNSHEVLTMVSPHHSEMRWLERARQAGAKLVITFGTQSNEIGSQMFCDPRNDYTPYPQQEGARLMSKFSETIIQIDLSGVSQPYTPLIDNVHEDTCTPGRVSREMRGPGNHGVPFLGLGFSADDDYLRQGYGAFSDHTLLGRQAKKEAKGRVVTKENDPVAPSISEVSE